MRRLRTSRVPFGAGGAGARPPCRRLCRHPRGMEGTHMLCRVSPSPLRGLDTPVPGPWGWVGPFSGLCGLMSHLSVRCPPFRRRALTPALPATLACRSLEAQSVLPPPGQVGFLSFRTSDHLPPSHVLHPEPVSSLRGLLGGEVALLARGPRGHQGVTPRLPAWCPPAPSCQNVGLRGAARSQSCSSSLIPSVRLCV